MLKVLAERTSDAPIRSRRPRALKILHVSAVALLLIGSISAVLADSLLSCQYAFEKADVNQDQKFEGQTEYLTFLNELSEHAFQHASYEDLPEALIDNYKYLEQKRETATSNPGSDDGRKDFEEFCFNTTKAIDTYLTESGKLGRFGKEEPLQQQHLQEAIHIELTNEDLPREEKSERVGLRRHLINGHGKQTRRQAEEFNSGIEAIDFTPDDTSNPTIRNAPSTVSHDVVNVQNTVFLVLNKEALKAISKAQAGQSTPSSEAANPKSPASQPISPSPTTADLSNEPSDAPSDSVSRSPSNFPNLSMPPSESPSTSSNPPHSRNPSLVPSWLPSVRPSVIMSPSYHPSTSESPSQNLKSSHSVAPSQSRAPSWLPSVRPSLSFSPSNQPTSTSESPSQSLAPSWLPSVRPSLSLSPSSQPTSTSELPSQSLAPSWLPSVYPSFSLSRSGQPTDTSASPSQSLPSIHPSLSLSPSNQHALPTSITSSSLPSLSPSQVASTDPSYHPTPTPPPTISQHPTPSIIGLWDKVLPLPSYAPSESPSHFPLPLPVKIPTDDPSQSGAPSYQPALISQPSLHPSQSLTSSITPSASVNIDFEPTLPTSTTISSLPSLGQSEGASTGPSYGPTPTSPPTISQHPTPSIIGLWDKVVPLPSYTPSESPSHFPLPTDGPSPKPTVPDTGLNNIFALRIPETSAPTISPYPSVTQWSTTMEPSESFGPTNDPPDVSSLASNPIPPPTPDPTPPPTPDPIPPPSAYPTVPPSPHPISPPSSNPISTSNMLLSDDPSATPSERPKVLPSIAPSERSSTSPSIGPSAFPSFNPSESISVDPSQPPSDYPSIRLSAGPSEHPSISPSEYPSMAPSNNPTPCPSFSPSMLPSEYPSMAPSLVPSETLPSFSPTSLFAFLFKSADVNGESSEVPTESATAVDSSNQKTESNIFSGAASSSAKTSASSTPETLISSEPTPPQNDIPTSAPLGSSKKAAQGANPSEALAAPTKSEKLPTISSPADDEVLLAQCEGFQSALNQHIQENGSLEDDRDGQIAAIKRFCDGILGLDPKAVDTPSSSEPNKNITSAQPFANFSNATSTPSETLFIFSGNASNTTKIPDSISNVTNNVTEDNYTAALQAFIGVNYANVSEGTAHPKPVDSLAEATQMLAEAHVPTSLNISNSTSLPKAFMGGDDDSIISDSSLQTAAASSTSQSKGNDRVLKAYNTWLLSNTMGFTASSLRSSPHFGFLVQAYADFASQVVSELANHSTALASPNRRHLAISFDHESAQIFRLTDSTCPGSAGTQTSCQHAFGQIDLYVDGKDAKSTYTLYVNSSQRAIDQGRLQETLNEIDPSSALSVLGTPSSFEISTTPAPSKDSNQKRSSQVASEVKASQDKSNSSTALIISSVLAFTVLAVILLGSAMFIKRKRQKMNEEKSEEDVSSTDMNDIFEESKSEDMESDKSVAFYDPRVAGSMDINSEGSESLCSVTDETESVEAKSGVAHEEKNEELSLGAGESNGSRRTRLRKEPRNDGNTHRRKRLAPKTKTAGANFVQTVTSCSSDLEVAEKNKERRTGKRPGVCLSRAGGEPPRGNNALMDELRSKLAARNSSRQFSHIKLDNPSDSMPDVPTHQREGFGHSTNIREHGVCIESTYLGSGHWDTVEVNDKNSEVGSFLSASQSTYGEAYVDDEEAERASVSLQDTIDGGSDVDVRTSLTWIQHGDQWRQCLVVDEIIEEEFSESSESDFESCDSSESEHANWVIRHGEWVRQEEVND